MKKKIAIATFLSTLFVLGQPVFAEDKTADQLIDDLKSENPALQIEAAKTIGEKKEQKAVPALVELLRNTQNNDVAWNAAAALGAVGKDGDATDLLIEKAKSGDAVVQYASVVALLNISKDVKKEKKDELTSTYTFLSTNAKDDILRDLATKITPAEKDTSK